MRPNRPALLVATAAMGASLVAAPAAAERPPQYEIDQEQVDGLVAALEAPPSEQNPLGTALPALSGEIAGAAWVGQVPPNWEGDLVVYAHGYRGEGTRLTVDPAPAHQVLLQQGVAWVASSYRRNSYDPGIGVLDTKNVTVAFERLLEKQTGEAVDDTFLAGFSMGGHVTGAAIERFPQLYDGALPMCGVMGDVELFDYFLDYNLAAAALAGVDADYPDTEWVDDEVPLIRGELSTAPGDFLAPEFGTTPVELVTTNAWASTGMLGFGGPYGDNLTDEGRRLKDFVEVGSGGQRVGYDVAWDYWHVLGAQDGDFFFDLGEGDGTIANRNGVVGQNVDTSYAQEYGDDFAMFDLDDGIERVAAADRVRRADGQKPAPIIHGTPSVPVLSLHTTGDLFVPIEQLQIYAQEVADNGLSDLLVTRAVRDVGHCSFTGTEIITAYADLFRWVEEGVRPDGEELRGAAISDPALGCDFTTGMGGSGFRDLVEAHAEPCPADDADG